jgi:hypothetical protein
MKKLAVLLAIVSVAVLAAPALSVTNPFMDVPMNHWAYDAIGQLAAHGILSGYPDGLYRGKQATTRYEMASALARALAVVDMTKASKQDVEMLKRLVVEFKDELEALGVRVDELDERVRVLESRLGGWHIHGSLVLDIKNESANTSDALGRAGDGSIGFDEARLFFERTWGEEDEYFFRARLRDEGGNNGRFDRFYVEMPFFGDSRLLVGRQNWDWEAAYRVNLGTQTGSWMGDSVLTDWTWTGLGLTKNFGMGQVQAAFTHAGFGAGEYTLRNSGTGAESTVKAGALPAWMLMARGTFQFTEQFGFDIGGQAYVGDNAETYNNGSTHDFGDYSFNSLWTIYAGLRFNFNENIAFKAIYYYQKMNSEVVAYGADGNLHWYDYGYGINANTNNVEDNAKHWSAMLDVKQDALKFTSVWLEYGQYDAGFYAPQGMSTFFNSESVVLQKFLVPYGTGFIPQLAWDMKYWRVILGQQWNDQWATHLFYNGYKLEGAGDSEAKPKEYGVGVQYKLNDYTTMGLNYIHVDNDGPDTETTEDNIVRFRTAVSF